MDTVFKIAQSSFNDHDHFAFHGNIDASAETLLKGLPEKVRRPVVRFDFSRTGRINSMGIALLLRCLKSIREEKNARVCLVQPSPMNAILFKMTGVLFLAELEK